jgi:hypothetical protein
MDSSFRHRPGDNGVIDRWGAEEWQQPRVRERTDWLYYLGRRRGAGLRSPATKDFRYPVEMPPGRTSFGQQGMSPGCNR